ncbi:MAG: hypothetical protein IKW03_09635 [Clostridia bacterium]|nr:hypothetical protein [Clostridia bacterium]
METVNENVKVNKKKILMNEAKARSTGKLMLFVTAMLVVAGAVISAVSVAFSQTEMETADVVGFIAGSFFAVLLCLIPDLMFFSMINKGRIRPMKSVFAVIINVLMLLVLLGAASMTPMQIDFLVIASLLGVYLTDVYLTVCLIARRTKKYTEKLKNGLFVTGLILSTVLLCCVLYCLIQLFTSNQVTDILSMFSSYYASLMYFTGNALFVYAGALSVFIND